MKISGFGSIDSTSSAGKKRATGATGSFADILAAAENTEAAPLSQTHDVAAAALTNLLALQEISEEDIRRKKIIQRGNNLLDSLEKLRNQLLMGTLSPQLLLDLTRQISMQKQTDADPRINDLIEEIELRAAVELAKLEKALEDKELRK